MRFHLQSPDRRTDYVRIADLFCVLNFLAPRSSACPVSCEVGQRSDKS